jgi:hypothetical protein
LLSCCLLQRNALHVCGQKQAIIFLKIFLGGLRAKKDTKVLIRQGLKIMTVNVGIIVFCGKRENAY